MLLSEGYLARTETHLELQRLRTRAIDGFGKPVQVLAVILEPGLTIPAEFKDLLSHTVTLSVGADHARARARGFHWSRG